MRVGIVPFGNFKGLYFFLIMFLCNHKMMIHDTTLSEFVLVNLIGVLRQINLIF